LITHGGERGDNREHRIADSEQRHYRE